VSATYDVVVLADVEGIAGSSGRREALALAATIRRLRQSGVGLVVIEADPRESVGMIGRLTERALSLSDSQVRRGNPDGLVAAVAELVAPLEQAVRERTLL